MGGTTAGNDSAELDFLVFLGIQMTRLCSRCKVDFTNEINVFTSDSAAKYDREDASSGGHIAQPWADKPQTPASRPPTSAYIFGGLNLPSAQKSAQGENKRLGLRNDLYFHPPS